MAWFQSLQLSLTGVDASRMRLEAAATNLANAESSAPDDASVYRVKRIQLSERSDEMGVAAQRFEPNLPPRLEYMPDHPDADEAGMVRFPEVDMVHELTEMMAARRAYEIGLSTFNEGRHIFQKTLEIGRE